MKNFSLIFIALICYSLNTNAQVFVNQNASGLNDGSSWADAFTDLQAAMDAAPAESQLWVAAGNYKPASSPNQNEIYFSLNTQLELYGGFNGTESELSQRDWISNLTIIDGDLNGDDLPDDFTSNKEDNALHNLLVDVEAEGSSIDGFNFINGWAEPTAPNVGEEPLQELTGGGILILAPITLKNSTFNQCAGFFGGAIGYRPVSSSDFKLSIEDCQVSNNFSEFGNIAIYDMIDGGIYNCSVNNNNCNSFGGGILFSESNGTIEGCSVENNNSLFGIGAGIYVTQRDESTLALPSVTIKNSEINFNTAPFGAGVCYINSFENAQFTLDSCSIKGNEAIRENEFGGTIGGLYIFNGPVANAVILPSLTTTVSNSIIEDNTAHICGGSYFLAGEDAGHYVTVKNTSFKGNSSEMFGGGAVSGNSISTFENCTFEANKAIDGNGGGLFFFSNDGDNNEEPFSKVLNCTFTGNQGFIGGALAFNNFIPRNSIVIEGTDFINNSNTDGIGGAMFINNSNAISNSSSLKVDITTALFEKNKASQGGGILLASSANELTLTMSNSEFVENFGQTGGALGLFNEGDRMTADITNTSFIGNNADDGSGGILSVNLDKIDIQKSHFSENSCTDGGSAITNSESNMTIESSLISQNIGSY